MTFLRIFQKLHLFVCARARVYKYTYKSYCMCMEVQGKSQELVPFYFNVGPRAHTRVVRVWWQTPLPAEPIYRPWRLVFFIILYFSGSQSR